MSSSLIRAPKLNIKYVSKVINLNKQMVSKPELMKYISDLDVYQKYIDEEVLPGKVMLSPFRTEKNPSFGFFRGENDEICFKDFTMPNYTGDCIKFVQLKFNLTYFEALSKIAIDFDMEDDFIVKKFDKTSSNELIAMNREEFLAKATTFDLKKTSRKWLLHDVKYWNQYGISITTLDKYNVQPISHFHINGKIITAEKHAYCFIEFKDNKETYKIYQPYSEKYKWLNGHNNSIWQGWSQLPEKNNILIITKSLKDVMSIYETSNIPAVALQCENVLPKPHVFEQLKQRFSTIYVFYDNDFDKEQNWGRIFSNKLCKNFNLIKLELDEKFNCKDFSDLIKKYDKKQSKLILNEMITNTF